MFLVLIPLKDAFSELFRLIRILTTAVNTAHCERSFSALKRIKRYLRSTMSEQTDLAILSIEQELSNSISLDGIIDIFHSEDHNRRIFLS